MKLNACFTFVLGLLFAGQVRAAGELVIATVNNGHMIEMQRLSREFEKEHPGIRLKWLTLEEDVLRRHLTADIASNGGQYDIMTIGMYEVPIWAKKGWLREIEPDAAYDVDDILPPIRAGLSVDGKLYAAPFYGESSMVMYRDDLVSKTGLTILDRHTWGRIREVAARIHDPANGIYGICLRGKPGWGDNLALITTMVNSYGGQWFDMQWKPQLNTAPWKEAVRMYVDLLKNYGPPDAANQSFNEILALFNKGRCGVWIDATIGASFITNPKQSVVADKVGFAQSPVGTTERGANWLWAWALAIPKSSRNAEDAQKFIRWATSREYINLVARESGWPAVPTGTRKSTYSNPGFRRISQFGSSELKAIYSANPKRSTLPPSPYIGVQFAAIPEFPAIGTVVAYQIHAALLGRQSVDKALEMSQQAAESEMRKGGYFK
jgi:sorbitol/mannitol transport system substrate-binding protein